MTVLILADEADLTAGRVAAELAGRGVVVHTFDPADFPLKLRLTAEIRAGGAWSGTIGGRDTGIDLGAVHAVYYRKPTQFKMPAGMSGPERVFAYSEARRGFGGVLQALSGCRWVNDPVAAARCEYKPVQLAAAAAVGLPIPPTLITSEPERAHAWATALGRPVVYKPLSGIWHADEGQIRAAQAQRNLKAAGYSPTVITGDGADGWPDGAPYDRVHVTCGITQIPYTWVAQCRPGGVIVLPWLPTGYAGHQLRLHVGSDGQATGRFHGGCGYMMMRSQRSHWNAHHAGAARTRNGVLDPRELAAADPGLHLVLAGLLPGVTHLAISEPDGSFSLLLFENRGEAGSWAAADHLPGTGPVQVTQYGDRSLWDEAEAAFDEWLHLGAPSRDRFGLTVDAAGQHLWIDAPSHVIEPPQAG